jgi:hypothetical protein
MFLTEKELTFWRGRWQILNAPKPPKERKPFMVGSKSYAGLTLEYTPGCKSSGEGGSPTIRMSGRDIAGESEELGSFALSCRLYPGAKQPGVPPAEMMRRAVREARATENP